MTDEDVVYVNSYSALAGPLSWFEVSRDSVGISTRLEPGQSTTAIRGSMGLYKTWHITYLCYGVVELRPQRNAFHQALRSDNGAYIIDIDAQ